MFNYKSIFFGIGRCWLQPRLWLNALFGQTVKLSEFEKYRGGILNFCPINFLGPFAAGQFKHGKEGFGPSVPPSVEILYPPTEAGSKPLYSIFLHFFFIEPLENPLARLGSDFGRIGNVQRGLASFGWDLFFGTFLELIGMPPAQGWRAD
jgi:hypothetical protein